MIFPARRLANNLLCFTTTREGGSSVKPYDTLNLAEHVSDYAAHVAKNRKALFDYLINYNYPVDPTTSTVSELANRTLFSVPSIAPLEFLNQTHSSVVINYCNLKSTPSVACDAVFTEQVNVPLVVMTADCLPIIISSGSSTEYAAVHAGWKGLAGGIIENAVSQFSANPNSLSAWIGPSICQHHFEVGSDVASQFSGFKACTKKGTAINKYHIDLSAVACQLLIKLGIRDVQASKICTYCRDDLFSFRQSTHQGYKDCGRMATVVIRY